MTEEIFTQLFQAPVSRHGAVNITFDKTENQNWRKCYQNYFIFSGLGALWATYAWALEVRVKKTRSTNLFLAKYITKLNAMDHWIFNKLTDIDPTESV